MLGGGSSGSVFGAQTADVMTKITRGAAFGFITLSLLLSFLFAKKDDRLVPEEVVPATIDLPDESGMTKPESSSKQRE